MKFKLGISYLFLFIIANAFADTDKYRLILVDDPSTTITIAWNQISGTNPVVHYDVGNTSTDGYGTNHLLYAFSQSPDRTLSYRGMNNNFVRLTGLTPNTKYYFLINDSEGTSNRFWFMTAPSDNSRLSFIAGGDSRNNSAARRNANLLVSKLKPHAVFFGGDMTDTNTSAEWQEWLDDWQLTTDTDGRMFPIVPAMGNHEVSVGSFGDEQTVYNLFDTPNDDSYYAITFGNNLIRAYTLNSEISVLGNQRTWLENDLNNSTGLNWKMAQYHKPMRPHTDAKAENNNQYSAWANLFYDEGVRLVVDCDSHMAKTTWPVKPSFETGNDEGFVVEQTNGTVYTGEGCWGAPLRENNDDKSWTRNSGSFNQFKLLFVDPQKIELRTIRVNNAAAVIEDFDDDPFTLPANLDIFTPETGAVVTISNSVDSSCPRQGTPCDDGNPNTALDEEDGNCNCVGLADDTIETYTKTVEVDSDDAEEYLSNGAVNIESTDLELVFDVVENEAQIVGVRFNNVLFPEGATLLRAYIQFEVDETAPSIDPIALLIHTELNTSSATFSASTNNISARPLSSNSISWDDVGRWNKAGESDYNQRTPYLNSIVNEVMSQSGWQSGDPLTFIISGIGNRVAEARDSGFGSAPKLVLVYNPNCPIASIAIGPSLCDDTNDTFTQELTLTYTDAPASGNLSVNGQLFPIATSPQTVILTGLTADGLDVDVNAFFTAEPNCSYARTDFFEAPSNCSLDGIPDNFPDNTLNLALLPEAVLSGSVTNGRGTPETILYDPVADDYLIQTDWNEYGVDYLENIGTPTVNDGMKWQVNWPNVKYVNYITFGGSYQNQDQSTTLWRISYRKDGQWTTLEEGQGAWLDDEGIYEWGGPTTNPIEADALRVQLYSDGQNDVVSVHLRARGGSSNLIDDTGTATKATLVQYLSPGNACSVALDSNSIIYCNEEWLYTDAPDENSDTKNTVIANGIYMIDSDKDVVINDLEIALGASLIVMEGGSLTIKGDLINLGSLILESTSLKYSSLIVEGTSSGNVTYNRHVNAFSGSGGNDLIASPLTGQTFGDFATDNPNLFENPGNSDQKLFGPFNESSGTYETYFTTTNGATALTKGTGYRAARNATLDVTYGTTLSFTGDVETTGFNMPLSESTSAFSGWNLIGNPYPSYIDFQIFFDLNKSELDLGIYQAIYGYDGDASNGWTILNDLHNGALIAPGQGFFVKAKPGGGTISFTPGMRIKGNSDDFILGRNSSSSLEYGFIGLQISKNGNEIAETQIYLNPNTSLGLDPGYDAAFFGGNAPSFCIYSKLADNSSDQPIAIQALNVDAINNLRLPIVINAADGEAIEISISQSSLNNGMDIVLEDTLNNSFTALTGGNYTFNAEGSLDQSGRFYLRFEAPALSNTDESLSLISIFADHSNRQIVINGILLEDTNFKLYDLNGRLISETILDRSKIEHRLNSDRLSQGIYIVQLTSDTQKSRIKKLIIQ